MADKILTIVVPTYNTESLLPRCLDSLIVEKSLMDLVEILVIIDGSPDNSIAVAKKYEVKYPNTFKVINKENGGHGSTINKGLELAKGKYFKVLDSDDWFDNHSYNFFLQRLINLEVDIVLTDYSHEFIHENKQEVITLVDFESNKVLDFDQINYALSSRTLFAMARTTFKTSVLRESKVILLEKTYYVDTILAVIPLFIANSIIYYPINLYRYYQGREEQSIAFKNLIKNRSHLNRVIRYLYNYYNSNKVSLSYSKNRYISAFLSRLFEGHLLLLNNLPYYVAKTETKEWNYFFIRLNEFKELNSKSFKLYNFLPYWMFRIIVKSYTKIILKVKKR